MDRRLFVTDDDGRTDGRGHVSRNFAGRDLGRRHIRYDKYVVSYISLGGVTEG